MPVSTVVFKPDGFVDEAQWRSPAGDGGVGGWESLPSEALFCCLKPGGGSTLDPDSGAEYFYLSNVYDICHVTLDRRAIEARFV